MDNPTISLCMIVKDEAENLPQCLESVKHIMDEIIITDTGSSDNTITIAESYGARVIRYPWQDNFAAARNRGLQEAAYDWILWLDADERLDLQEGKKLKELLTRDAVTKYNIEALQFILKNYIDNRVEQMGIFRMVRNRPEYRFTGNIHEQILPSMLRLYPNCIVGQVDIHIHHYGYMTQNMVQRQRIERNIRLLLQAQAEDPGNPVHAFYLGIELYRCDKLVQALNHFNILLMNLSGIPDTMIAFAYKLKCLTLQLLDRYEELVHCSEEGLAKFKSFADLYHLKAQGLHALGRTHEAIDVLRQAVQIGPIPVYIPLTEGYGSYATYYELGTLYESLGEFNQAKECYFQAQQLQPDFLPAREARDRLTKGCQISSSSIISVRDPQ